MSKARDIADLDFNSPDIDGGNIDGATIGATNPAAGTFTSITSGSVAVTGDVNVSSNYRVNGTLLIDSSMNLQNLNLIQVATGSSTAPSIRFTGDTNTGFARPAVDTLGLITGGVESLRITSAGATFNSTITSGAVSANNVTIGSGNSTASIFRPGTDGSGLHFTTNAILPTDQTGTLSNGTEDFGAAGQKFKDGYFSGTLNSGPLNSGAITSSGNITAGNNANINIPTASSGNANLSFDGTTFDIVSNSSSATLKIRTNSSETVSISNTGNFRTHRGNATIANTLTIDGGGTTDPYLIIDGSTNNRDSGLKINSGGGVQQILRMDVGNNLYIYNNEHLINPQGDWHVRNGNAITFNRPDNSRSGSIFHDNDGLKIEGHNSSGEPIFINAVATGGNTRIQVAGTEVARFADNEHILTGKKTHTTVDRTSPTVPSGLTGGLVCVTPIYQEYQFLFSGQTTRTLDFFCPSYFMAEFTYTSHQTNGGSDIHRYIKGKWANNHSTHTFTTYHDSGNTWALSTSFTATDHTGNNTDPTGRLRIVQTYGSGSYAHSTVTLKVYYGSITSIAYS